MSCSDNRITGKNGYVEFDGQQVAKFRSFEPNRTIDTVEVTAGGDNSKVYKTTQKDGTASLTLVYDPTLTTLNAKFVVGTCGNLLWGPNGNASGEPKGGNAAYVTEVGEPFEYAGEVVWTIQFQFTGDALFDTASDTW